MATPSSSATSPSPPMTYLTHNPVPTQPNASTSKDPFEGEQRQKAIKKFLARAEISMVTRALRTRLSYASYKATHNIHHVSLHDLEARSQSQSQAASFSRTIAAKRKAVGTNHYNNPTTQGLNGMSGNSSLLRRGGSGTMPPPITASSPRAYYPMVNGNTHSTLSNTDSSSNSGTLNLGTNLYTSILTPPPTKQVRTIHNARDPPVPASSKPMASPRTRTAKPAPRNTTEGTRSSAKNKKVDNASNSPSSPKRHKVKSGSTDKGRHKQVPSMDMEIDVDGDVDMKAAATLTSLLLHHRPSISGSASSPRSSVDSSEPGSTYSHFAQSSARTVATTSPPPTISASTTTESSFRIQTPPPGPKSTSTTTPRPAPADNEAASLMLFLATSPSPARPANKDSKDLGAYRALGRGPGVLRDKGRVLFTSGAEPESFREPDKTKSFGRGEDTSFTSSMSSIGTEMDVDSSPESIASRPVPMPSQLLPPASLPQISTPRNSVPGDINGSPRPTFTQGPVEFNFNDFIHASPSPSRGTVVHGPKSNLSLRADIGRKLFEEEQLRHALTDSQDSGPQREERSLAAGIDLIPS